MDIDGVYQQRKISMIQMLFIPNNSTTLRRLNFDRIFTINEKMCGILLKISCFYHTDHIMKLS